MDPALSATAATLAKEIVMKAAPSVWAKLSSRLSQEVMRLQVNFINTFQDHLEKSYEKCFQVKTIVSRDEPVELESIYVPLTLRSGEDDCIEDDTLNIVKHAESRFIVSGTGGAGKTFLTKHLFNLTKLDCNGFVPLFVELRNLEFDSAASLEECIYTEISQTAGNESLELFLIALEEGLFAIYLDGFDEVHPKESDTALRYIKRFSEKYRSVPIIVSSRPKTGVESLQNFKVFHVNPLSKKQAIEVVNKTPFDGLVKRKFISELENRLYDNHPTLMSLPILVSMMLIAFRTYADIPDRMTVFYSQAFEILYSIHDAENKELFKRQHRAGLAPDQFKMVLQAFCYISLSNHDIEFSDESLIDYIGRALKISRINLDPILFKEDLVHNVCVLQPEGITYVFVHRSFQEYFAAQFAINFSGENKFGIFDKIIAVAGSSVASMMSEIDSIKVERFWVQPKLKQLHEALAELCKLNVFDACKEMFFGFVLDVKKRKGRAALHFSKFDNPIKTGLMHLEAVYDPKLSLQAATSKLSFNLADIIAKGKKIKDEDILPDDAICFSFSGRLFVVEKDHEDIIEASGFSEVIDDLKNKVRISSERLERRLTEYRKLEDSELMS